MSKKVYALGIIFVATGMMIKGGLAQAKGGSGKGGSSVLLRIAEYSDISCHFCYALVHGQPSRGEAGL